MNSCEIIDIMELEVPVHILKKLSGLSRGDRQRIKRKLDDIDYKIAELGIEPEKVIEKRLGGGLHPFLQQRVGGGCGSERIR